MKMYLINVEDKSAGFVDIPASLDSYYEHLNCRTIDICTRYIAGQPFDIVCDDEALLVENPIVSCCTPTGKPLLCGNLLICGTADEDGDLTELTDDDMALISNRVVIAHSPSSTHPVLLADEC